MSWTDSRRWLFIHPLKDLGEKEQQERATICHASLISETIYQLVQTFLQIVRTRKGKITKFKLIKYMVYGRAGFPLHLQRMLHAA